MSWISVNEKIPILKKQEDGSYISKVVPVMVEGIAEWETGYYLRSENRNRDGEWIVIDHCGDWEVVAWYNLKTYRVKLKQEK